MKTIAVVVIAAMIGIGTQYGIKPVYDRLFYGPDKSDCIRIEGCQDGDYVSWNHSDIDTYFVCVDNEWVVLDPVEDDEFIYDNDQEKF